LKRIFLLVRKIITIEIIKSKLAAITSTNYKYKSQQSSTATTIILKFQFK